MFDGLQIIAGEPFARYGVAFHEIKCDGSIYERYYNAYYSPIYVKGVKVGSLVCVIIITSITVMSHPKSAQYRAHRT